MDSAIYQLIESPDPKDRKRAVKLLAQDGSQEAIKLLGQLYKRETDPEIKDLAVKAGQYIKKQQQSAKWEGGGRPAAEAPAPPPVAPDLEDVVVSPAAEERARGLMEQALDYLMTDNRTKAIETARKAFQINPHLRKDSYYMGIANEITGHDNAETVEMLLAKEPKGGKEKAKRKSKNDEEAPTATWGDAIADLAIYGLVNAAIIIVGMLLMIQLIGVPLRDALATMPTSGEFSTYEEAQMQQQLAMISSFLTGAGIITSIMTGVSYAVASIIALLIQLFFIHIAATMVLGGDGTFPGLIRKVTNFLTVVTVISTIFSLFVIYLTLDSSIAMAASGDMAAMETMNSISLVMVLVSIIGSIVMLYVYCQRIGAAYDFGAGKGCLSVIISSIMMAALSCVLQLACSAILSDLFVNMMMSSSGGF